MSRQVGAFTPSRAQQINDAVRFLEQNGYNVNRGRRTGYRQPVEDAIIDLRLSGNNLQYTKDGVNWVTWHTATECPPT